MKRIIIILLAAIPALTYTSCKLKYTTDNITEKIVEPHYPTITLKGDQFISIPVSATGTYTDAGAQGLDDNDGKIYDLIPESAEVDLTTAGFYTVIYSFKNTDGYGSTATRFILVTGVDSATDYTGEYRRTSNNSPMNVEKVATGLYKTDNVGGVLLPSAFALTAYFGLIDDSTIVVPEQPTDAGILYCSNSFLRTMTDTTGGATTDTTISWIVRNPSFGTAQRTFSHQ
ncbi:MAG: DUF5011 domain-containing protein [Chitinophagaceae bacterium]|nr:DUF5011 domain-containing protein [Chitinophagaceae bacterium]